MALSSDVRVRMLQAATLSAAQLSEVRAFIVNYLGDTLDRVTHGQVLIHQAESEVQVKVLGECAVLLHVVTPIINELLELLYLELFLRFMQTQPPLCGTTARVLIPSSPPPARQPSLDPTPSPQPSAPHLPVPHRPLPSPAAPLPSLPPSFPVTLTIHAAGDVSDYDTSRVEAIQTALAVQAGVPVSMVTVQVRAASVIITAEIHVSSSAGAALVTEVLQAQLSTTTRASALLGITVLSGNIEAAEIPSLLSPPPRSSPPRSPPMHPAGGVASSISENSDESSVPIALIAVGSVLTFVFLWCACRSGPRHGVETCCTTRIFKTRRSTPVVAVVRKRVGSPRVKESREVAQFMPVFPTPKLRDGSFGVAPKVVEDVEYVAQARASDYPRRIHEMQTSLYGTDDGVITMERIPVKVLTYPLKVEIVDFINSSEGERHRASPSKKGAIT